MKIHGNFQNLEMCGIYQWSYRTRCRAPQTGHPWKESEHCACLRVWKHMMKCNNKNQFGKKKLNLPYHGAPDDRETHLGRNVQRH
jgi:hypothetical protein